MKRIHLIICISLSLFSTISFAQDNPAEWPLCKGTLDIPPRPIVEGKLQPGETFITADQADMIEGGLSHLEGNVEITQDNQQTRSDRADYDQEKGTADFQGNFHYWDEATYLNSDSAHIDFNADTRTFQNAEYRLIDNRGRGVADELYIIPGKLTKGKRIDFTTCDPDTNDTWDFTNNVWKISARKMVLNYKTNRGSATHAVLKVKDIPVFYTPYINFPLNRERKTGFLVPSYGTSNRNGTEIRTPFYWNIAPNMDATITPRLISDSGLMTMAEFRYLFAPGRGILNFEYLPSDSQFNDADRHFVSFEHSQYFSGRLWTHVLFNDVSDTSYFEDFGATQSVTSIQYLERRGDASYSSDHWNISALVQDYQIVDSNLPITSRPYRRLPQVVLNAFSTQKNLSFNYNLKSEAVYFQRGDDPSLSNVEGVRLDLFPTVSYPVRSISGFFVPKAGLRYTQYALNENLTFQDQSPNRILPMLSVDSGLYFDKEDELFGHGYSQTLEPRIFYLYIPEDDQTDLPIFDTSIYDISSSAYTLFYEDRFTNADRMGDANQFTVSLTSRFQLYGTSTQGSITVGQAFFLRDREVVLPGYPIQQEAYSPLIIEYSLTPFRNFNISGDYQWDFDNQISRKFSIQAQYRPIPDSVFNFSYRRLSAPTGIIRQAVTSLEQTDFSFRLPITKQFSVIGRWYYDLPQVKSLEIFGGLEYNSCCFALRLVGRRFLSSLTGLDEEFQTGIYMQIELKGLAGTGRKTVDFLSENIPGYQSGF